MEDETEVETIHGFDIPKRELTEEEKNREVTLERFSDFHADAGEDFVDQCESFFNKSFIAGYLLCKYPENGARILEVSNNAGGLLDLKEIYEDEDGEDNYFIDEDRFYTDLAEIINLTKITKERVNQVLIQVYEYYND